jgi:esterase/lipase superfamily enzyme
MWRVIFVRALCLLALWSTGVCSTWARPIVSRLDPRAVISDVIEHYVRSSNPSALQPFSPGARKAFTNEIIRRLRRAGPLEAVQLMARTSSGSIVVFRAHALQELGHSAWWLGYNKATARIEDVFVHVVLDAEQPARPDAARPSVPPPELCRAFEQACKATPLADKATVDFLFATTRAKLEARGKLFYSGARSDDITFGAARVSVPENHGFGHVELPKSVNLFRYTLYEEKLDPARHFVIKAVKPLDESSWNSIVRDSSRDEALIFVHGFNTSFDDALYREAQIVWDMRFAGLPVLFSWASKGSLLDYYYDQQSAVAARQAFATLIAKLHDELGVKKINVIAHSMGNSVVLGALMDYHDLSRPLLSELIMVAPDVDRDYYVQTMPKIEKLAASVTLYASSADRAMVAAKKLAGASRAGDFVGGVPTLVPGVETIDVTAIGSEIFGLNHDLFANSRSAIDDIGLIIKAHLHPPRARLSEIVGMPNGLRPSYWRYAR